MRFAEIPVGNSDCGRLAAQNASWKVRQYAVERRPPFDKLRMQLARSLAAKDHAG
jgi:hypothetical protein